MLQLLKSLLKAGFNREQHFSIKIYNRHVLTNLNIFFNLWTIVKGSSFFNSIINFYIYYDSNLCVSKEGCLIDRWGKPVRLKTLLCCSQLQFSELCWGWQGQRQTHYNLLLFQSKIQWVESKITHLVSKHSSPLISSPGESFDQRYQIIVIYIYSYTNTFYIA